MTLKKSVRYWQSGRSVHYQRNQLDGLILDLTKTGHKKVHLEMSVQDLVDLRASLEAAPVCPPTTGELISEIRDNAELRKAVASWQAERIRLMTQVATAVKALRFYAAGDAGHKVLGRREFGCGCCAGVVMGSAEDPDLDFGRDVIGLTAREALEKIRGMK